MASTFQSSTSESERVSEDISIYSSESKQRLKDALECLNSMLLENNLIAQTVSPIISEEARLVADDLFEYCLDMLAKKKIVSDEELILPHESDEDERFECVKSDVSSDDYEPEHKKRKDWNFIPLDFKIKAVNMAAEHPHWSLQNLQKKGCSKLKHKKYLKSWAEQIKKGGTTFDKYNIVDSWTYDRFVEARESFEQVTTRNLQQWALAAASQFSDFDFKASHAWVVKFKQKHAIRQRKITKFVTAKECVTIRDIMEAAEEFRIQTCNLISKFEKDYIINTDQTGCAYQFTFDRSLAEKGAKSVLVRKQNLNKVTHSYTAQYAITMSGKILPVVFLCLQEPTGKFGPRVQQTVDQLSEKYANVIVMASKSGKLTSQLYKEFLKGILLPYVGQKKFLLLIDSWRGQVNPAVYDELFKDEELRPTCKLKVIPPKCTPLCQPCDVYFYRQVKNIIKRLQNSSYLIEQG